MRQALRLPLEALAPFLLELPQSPAPLLWPGVFSNDYPVELEVGFGKGGFLLAAGEANPGTNYVGVEIDRALQLYVATRIAKRALRNVRVTRADARLLLRDYVGPGSLSAIHVYFPDPWWKKRHKKRRVFTAEFATLCARALCLGGVLHIASDVEEYSGVMAGLIEANPGFVPLSGGGVAVVCMTNFERKAHEQGRGVWRALYRRL